jgi:hypothetical protein
MLVFRVITPLSLWPLFLHGSCVQHQAICRVSSGAIHHPTGAEDLIITCVMARRYLSKRGPCTQHQVPCRPLSSALHHPINRRRLVSQPSPALVCSTESSRALHHILVVVSQPKDVCLVKGVKCVFMWRA